MHYIEVIIPHRNTPKLLQRLLDSIPEMDGVGVIIVDDGSDEAIVDFDKFPGKDRTDTQIFLQQMSRGAGHARNIGLEHADAQYVLFADADDFFLPNSFDLFMTYVQSVKDEISTITPATTSFDIVFFNVTALKSDLHTPSKRADYYNDYFRCHDIQLLRYTSGVPWAKMVKLSVIRHHHIEFDETFVANDAYFSCLLAIFADRVAMDDHVVYCCTENEGSLKVRVQSTADRITRCQVVMCCNKALKLFGHGIYHLNATEWLFGSRHIKDWLPLHYIVSYVRMLGVQALKDMYWFFKYH